jgi:ABC-2 type transport system ATP-binding protein
MAGPAAGSTPGAGVALGALVLTGLTKLYEPTPRWMRIFARSHIKEPILALDDVDLRVNPGEICTVIGPNGAGKTTLFRIIVGLTSCTAGSGSVFGLDISRNSEDIRQVVGWMPSEDRSLLMRATCRENLQLHGRLQGISKTELPDRIGWALDLVDLEHQTNAVVASLSAGMKARLRLARALLPRPYALILDEPTGAVDPIAAHGLLNLIVDLASRDRLAVLISSHRLEEIEALSSRALLLHRGRVRYSGDLQHLRELWDHPSLQLAFKDIRSATVAADRLRATGFIVTLDGDTITCSGAVTGRVGSVLGAIGELVSQLQHVRETPMPLRDLIARVYSEPSAEEQGTTTR